jgi:endonuclease/exonuclease/phosphatase family metal-dependent hydrolase
VGILMRAVLPVLLLAGCGLDVGATAEWIDVESVTGQLASEMGGSTRALPIPMGAGDVFRVVSFNVEMGGDAELLATQIHANAAIANASLFLIQEQERYPEEGMSRARRLAQQLDLGYVYVPGRIKKTGTHGLSMMSRFPIENIDVMMLPRTDGGTQRIAISADVVIGETRLRVVNVHLETHINITERIVHFRPAVIELPQQVLVAGDVNTNPYLWEDGSVPLVPTAQIVDTDQAPLLDDYMRAIGFDTPAADIGPTERMLGVESRLDAIYTRGLNVTKAIVERSVGGSDHWPVWLDVTLP